ncbi:MAG: hypothetical protein JOZ28_01205 [Candidatus Eremiobacteraeota bacterium]|nr:hypothetical protein [Candidatus Eremiobacteraeota bacterium]
MKMREAAARPIVAVALVCAIVFGVPLRAAPARTVSVLAVWRIPAPLAPDSGVQSVEAGIIAVNFLGPELLALARHPGAKATVAVDPVFVNALEHEAAGQSALGTLASGQIGANDLRAAQLLDVLSSDVVPDADIASTPVGKRYLADASAARLSLMGDTAARFSQVDDIDFAAGAVLVSLASNGGATKYATLLHKNALTGQDLTTLSSAFAHACAEVLSMARKAAANGELEIAALPANEPIMPLIINAAGRRTTSPFTVDVAGSADVAAAIDEGLRMARSLAPEQGAAGLLSPSGAYNDETAVILQARHAAYGIFSERVVKANAGASAEAVSDVHAAAFRAYLLETSKADKLPVLFCSDATSNALDSQPPSAPATAMADRLQAAVSLALSAAPAQEPAVMVLCLNGTGAVLRRADRALVLDDLSATMSAGRSIRAATPKAFMNEHRPTSETYGYAPGSDVGGFDLWMGSANQASLWNALNDARKAAGGDSAVANPAVRDALLRAESGVWYLALAIPQPRYLLDRYLADFRALIAEIYRGAGKTVPSNVAPVQLETPQPVGVPGT